MFQFQFKFRIFWIIKFENFLEYSKIFRKLFRIILEIGNFLRNLYKLTILTKIKINCHFDKKFEKNYNSLRN